MHQPSASTTPIIRFGVFQVDLRAGDLRKNGVKIKLEGQPFQVLALLLERPGQLVTREELRQKLWPADTFVDFEHGINVAVKRLRESLDDSADTPRFIETLPRRGYRFIYPVEGLAAEVRTAPAWWRRRWAAGLLLALPALLMGMLTANIAGLRDRLLSRPVAGEITSIAVLPLKNLSGDPEQEYFAAGMTEALITELGRVGAVRVPSHQTVLQYSRTTKPLSEIARELKADALIEGTVLRSGNRVRITINLVQVEPERHLLAEKYDRDMRDVLMVQDEVTRAVTSRIRASLTPELQRHFAKSRPVDPQVNEAYLKGRFHMQRGTDADRAKAHKYFQEAVQKDPAFALGYASMALLDAHGGSYRGAGAGSEFRAQTRQLALKALELDDTLAEAHTALGWLEFRDWDFAGADREFKRAIELNPNLVVARIWYAPFLGAMLRFQEADAQCEIALQLQPASPDVLTHVAWAYRWSGRMDKVIELSRKALDLEPNYAPAHHLLGIAYYTEGMYPEAVAELEKAIAVSERNNIHLSVLAPAYIKAGRREEGMKIVRELEQRAPGPGGGRGLVHAYLALGQKDKAFGEMEAMVERRAPNMAFVIAADSNLEPLRDDPRFHDIVRRVGLPTEGLPSPKAAPVRTAGQQQPK